ncbi:MAG: Gfo/Idh/MocA family oxidoreductase [Verrucomicrobia bacterium]|nr:Gfo/Idh/MocA family oxidoreductase [Verrucomicrobiota bacterium]
MNPVLSFRSSRRRFLRRSAAVTAGFPLISRLPVLGANSRLNIAGIGVGGKGMVDITGCDTENLVALCDVDDVRAADAFKRFPDARRFRDFRQMFDRMGRGVDAVTVSTPDHMHFLPAMWAIERGMGVYCQKPLTHTIDEARRLTEAARRKKVATQMGNQGRSNPQLRREVEWVRAGVLGTVHEVHCWTDRPGRWWKQGMEAPTDIRPAPATLDWDLWLGVAAPRPYSPAYAPFAWRGFWDFGTGALGDMGCHLFNLPDMALGIRDATRVEAWSEGMTHVAGPRWSVVRWDIPAEGPRPAFTLWWYDGGKLPPAALFPGETYADNGVIFVGDRDVMLTNYNGGAKFRSGRTAADFRSVPETLPKCTDWDRCHYREWIEACKGGPKALSDFEVAGPMTEVVLLGNVAVRSGRPLTWDRTRMRVTNDADANRWVRQQDRRGWTL